MTSSDVERSPDHQAQPNIKAPGLAIVMNGATPYNINLCRRLVRELTELKLHSILTIDEKIWSLDFPKEINLVCLGDVQSNKQTQWSRIRFADYLTAGRIFEYFQANNIRAVLLAGTASLMHLRLISMCHRAGIPLFLRGDSNIMGERTRGPMRTWFKRRLLNWVFPRLSGVMPMGEFGRQYFAKYGADLSRCYIVPHEPDYELFTEIDPESLVSFRQRRGLGTNRLYLLSCCRLVPVKRVDLLIDAFAAIAAERPDWDLVLIGDGPLRAELETRVPAQISERVKWLGFCEVDEVRLAFRAADVFVLPSDFEPWAVVINEAAAAGLVTVASDVVGAAKDLVKSGVNGRIFESGSVSDLTAALREVTDLDTYQNYQKQVEPIFQAWRKSSDQILGIRKALEDVEVL